MSKILATCAIGVAIVLLLLYFRGNQNTAKPSALPVSLQKPANPGSDRTYFTLNRAKEIRFKSDSEIELTDYQRKYFGHYVISEGGKIIATYQALGTTKTRAFNETPEGFVAEGSGEQYVTAEVLKANDAKAEAARQTLARKAEEELQPIDGLAKEISIEIADGVSLNLMRILPGTFTMGDKKHQPSREVTISKPFYMGKYEVTQEQFEALMPDNPSQFEGPKHPVETLSWNDAQEFCRKLSAKSGKKVRLPTEAEWEFACRGGTTTPYYSGSALSDLESVGWNARNSSKTTHPVGKKEANAFGLYDMHGNVWEFCQDWFGPRTAATETDPQGPASGIGKVVRGGAWTQDPNYCEVTSRCSAAANKRNSSTGFRVVVEP